MNTKELLVFLVIYVLGSIILIDGLIIGIEVLKGFQRNHFFFYFLVYCLSFGIMAFGVLEYPSLWICKPESIILISIFISIIHLYYGVFTFSSGKKPKKTKEMVICNNSNFEKN